MPTYDYKCPQCGTEFEQIVSKPDPSIPQPCPKCEASSPTFIPQGGRDKVRFLFNYMAPDA